MGWSRSQSDTRVFELVHMHNYYFELLTPADHIQSVSMHASTSHTFYISLRANGNCFKLPYVRLAHQAANTV